MLLSVRVCMLGLVLLMGHPLATSSATGALDETVTLALGAGSQLTLDRPFDTILIDNPDVVDVRALNDQLIVLEPLNLGASNVLFVDEHNIAIANIRVVVCDPRRDRAAIIEPIYAGRPVPSFRRHAT
jgi:Flp pilus assembly secretin CpaC